MKRIVLIWIAIVAAVSATAADTQRNIVFILIDDQRFDALGMLNPYFDTPHLDALAANGVLFENAFVTTSLCSPSRASILTGQWAHSHGVLDNRTPLPSVLPTFPKRLQEADYETAFIGKWHMGGSSDAPRAGFDRWVSFRGQGVYYDPTFNVDGEQVKLEGYTTDLITDYAVDFLEAQDDSPFMMYVSHKAVHDNFSPAQRHKDSYAERPYPKPSTFADTDENYAGKPDWVREQRPTWHGVDGLYNNRDTFDEFTKRYAEAMRAVDDSVGRIVASLEKKGLLESTLLVFTSDNGFQFGEHGLIDKRTMYEASIRVPLIVHCPELFEGGQRRKQMVLNTDFFPTFLDAVGLDTPDTVQGQTFWDVLQDSSATGREAWLYTYFWERSFPQTPTVLGVRTDRYKFMQFHGIYDRYELYDLEKDPDETTNLLANVVTTTEAGRLGARVRGADIDDATKDLFFDLERKLQAELKRLGCAPEPNWRPTPEVK